MGCARLALFGVPLLPSAVRSTNGIESSQDLVRVASSIELQSALQVSTAEGSSGTQQSARQVEDVQAIHTAGQASSGTLKGARQVEEVIL